METNCGLPFLEGDGFVLRSLTRADADAMLALLGQPGVRRWWGIYDSARLDRDFYDPAWAYTYLVETNGDVAGAAQFHEEPEPEYRSVAVDIAIADAYQDRGLGTKVLQRIVRYLIDERGHHRVTIDPSTDNARAIRVYEKVGFKPVGVMRRYERGIDGQWHDALLMDLLAEEFERD
ncbi:MAG: GNAT family N-acetyltransferase [Coriobacteriia bacterium]